jgi:hypothetical protein
MPVAGEQNSSGAKNGPFALENKISHAPIFLPASPGESMRIRSKAQGVIAALVGDGLTRRPQNSNVTRCGHLGTPYSLHINAGKGGDEACETADGPLASERASAGGRNSVR